MNYKFITADWIYPVSSPRIREGVVVMDGDRIVDITARDQVPAEKLEHHTGIIIPGFINTHCHLELSHLKGKIPTGTGLLPFIYRVVKFRDSERHEIDNAMTEADLFMWEQGIQAVGDICNKADTFPVKEKSNIRYYSFVEMFDFMQIEQSGIFTQGFKDVYKTASGIYSAVPHAPYSVSPKLFADIKAMNEELVTVSIHNQETKAEDDLFRKGHGDFLDFYKSFDLSLDHFTPIHTSSIHYSIRHLDPMQRTLFVHNTLTTKEDIEVSQQWSKNTFWATCPNANLYIENRLPSYQTFIEAGSRMTIGTDSLTSNWQLSVLEEMKTIAKYQSFISFDTLLSWATLNGAEALGFDDMFGSLEKSKRPGILLMDLDPDSDSADFMNASVRRLV